MRDLSEPIVEHTIKFILSRKVDVHKDDEYYGFFDTINDAKLHFEKLGFHLSFKGMKITQTGVVVFYFKISKPNEKIMRKQLLKHTIIKNGSIYSNIVELEVNIIDKDNKTSVVDVTTHYK